MPYYDLGEFASNAFVVSHGVVRASNAPDAYNYEDAHAALIRLQQSINRWAKGLRFSPVAVDAAVGPSTVSAARKVIAHLVERYPGAQLPNVRDPDAPHIAMFSVEFAETFNRYSPPQPALVARRDGPGYAYPSEVQTAGVSGANLPLILLGAGVLWYLNKKKSRKGRKGKITKRRQRW